MSVSMTECEREKGDRQDEGEKALKEYTCQSYCL